MRYSFKEIKRKFSGRKCQKMSVMEVVKYYETLPPYIQTEMFFFSLYNRDGNIPMIIIFVIVFIAFIFSSLLLLLVDQTDELDVGKKKKKTKQRGACSCNLIFIRLQ